MEAGKNASQNKEANIVRRVWSYYFAYWPMFVVSLLLCMGAAWLFLRYSSPTYAANATLLIKDQMKGVDDAAMVEALNLTSSKKIIENEIEVIKSRTLMEEVVNKLSLYAPVYKVGRIKSEMVFRDAPIKIESRYPDTLTPAKKVDFTCEFNSGGDSIVRIDGQKYALNTWVSTPYGQLRFTGTAHYDAELPSEAFYFTLMDPQKVVEQMAINLDVMSQNKMSTVLTVQVKDKIPQRAEDILNQLILAYNKASVRDKNHLAENTLHFLDERIELVAKDLDSIEHQIQQYKAEKGATDISAEGRLFLENVSKNDQRLGDYKIQMAVLDQIESVVRSDKNTAGIVASTLGVDDPLLADLLKKLNEQELEYERLKKTTAENNPLLSSLTSQLQKLRESILNNIAGQKRSLSASRKNLANTNNSYSYMLKTIPKKERDLVEISRAQSVTRGTYDFLVQKREEVALSYSSNVSDNRIVDKGKAMLLPVSPNKKVVYLIAIVFSMVIPIGFVSGRDMFSNKVLYRREIEEMTSIPVIAEIELEKNKNAIVVNKRATNSIGEQFRKLRASLKFLHIDSVRKRILVTSSVPGEGKSFVCLNLALTLALTGKRVILLEADLVKPSISDKLGIKPEVGLSEYLEGSADLVDIVNSLEQSKNLFIIPSGKLPENPSELVLNGKLEELLRELDRVFDYIILDTAPVACLSDAYELSPLCDATLYLVRHKRTPKVFIERLEEEIRINELKNVGIVFNAVAKRGFVKTSSYGYGYQYNYTYSYSVNS
jgi:capsular exopolysaccharide synthesis family protein